jgi:hypothetical protein
VDFASQAKRKRGNKERKEVSRKGAKFAQSRKEKLSAFCIST